MTAKSKQTDWEVVDAGVVEFDIHDERNRRVGYWGQIAKVTTAEITEGENFIPRFVPPGTHYEVRAQATRNGKPYGASNGNKLLPSLAEAKAEVERQAKACERRYSKKYAKAA